MLRKNLLFATALVFVARGCPMPVTTSTGRWVNPCATENQIEEPETAVLHGTTQNVRLVKLKHKQRFEVGYCKSSTPVGYHTNASTCQTVKQRHHALVYIMTSQAGTKDLCKKIPLSEWSECWKLVNLPGPCRMMVMRN